MIFSGQEKSYRISVTTTPPIILTGKKQYNLLPCKRHNIIQEKIKKGYAIK